MSNTIFDKEVSVYRNVTDSVGKPVPLCDFLFDYSLKDKILHIRGIEDKTRRNALKRTLPCATISGVFFPSRKSENLQQHSGLICLDIDGKDNPVVTDWENLKSQLSALPQIAFCGLSLSGHGLFLIVPIAYPSFHKQHFLQLHEDFQGMGITLDRSCGDVCRLRTMSYDANPYINENATVYNKVKVEQRHHPSLLYYESDEDVIDKVIKCCREIEMRHIDITSTYDDWIRVGFALASLGERGREFFHVCSQQNEKYNYDETNKKFNSLLKCNGNISIATFFAACKQHGINWH
jgi:hypothetical protein